jgi:uncharacterized membrane protein
MDADDLHRFGAQRAGSRRCDVRTGAWRAGRPGRAPDVRRRLVGVIAASLAVLTLAALLAAPPAFAKSYTMPRVTIDGTVEPDGSMQVVETRTFDFSGTFHFVYWDLRTKGAEVIKVQGVSTPSQTFARSASGGPGTYSVGSPPVVRVQANFELSDVSVPFTLRYIVAGAAKRWSDTAELYWQFIGDQWAVGVGDATITIHLPAGVTRDQVRAWGHGPLNGTVKINPDASVTLHVTGLSPSTFVEARVIFPAAALSAAVPAGGPHLQSILAQEKALAEAANAERASARRKVRLAEYGGLALAAAGFVLWLVLFLRFGREHKPSFTAQYYRDIPEEKLPPAVVGYLWKMGSIGNPEITATLLDLADRGVVELRDAVAVEHHLLGEKEKKTYQLVLQRDKYDGLQPHEKELVDFLIGDMGSDDAVTIEELRESAKDDPKTFREDMQSWKAAVSALGRARGYFEASGTAAAVASAVVGGLLIVVSALLIVYSRHVLPAAGIVVGVLMIASFRGLQRRTAAGAEAYAKYRGVYNYMKDFGRMDEKPPTSVVLWQQFLVLAVVFGIADQVMKSMQVKVPEVVGDPAFSMTTGYWMMAGMSGGGSPLAAVTGGLSAAATAASPSSSASGAGGGFSGGGGFGGGGMGGGVS